MPATGGPTIATRRSRSPRGRGTCAPYAARPPFEHTHRHARCDSSQPALPIDSARNQALAAEHLAYVVDVGVRVGQDEVAGLQRVDGQRLAGLTYLCEQGGECGPERHALPGVDRAGQLVVKGVELGDGFVVQLVLAFGEDSDDHLPSPSSSLRGSAAP